MGGINYRRAGSAMNQHLFAYQGSGIQDYGHAAQNLSTPQSDQIGGTRSGSNEIDFHNSAVNGEISQYWDNGCAGGAKALALLRRLSLNSGIESAVKSVSVFGLGVSVLAPGAGIRQS